MLKYGRRKQPYLLKLKILTKIGRTSVHQRFYVELKGKDETGTLRTSVDLKDATYHRHLQLYLKGVNSKIRYFLAHLS